MQHQEAEQTIARWLVKNQLPQIQRKVVKIITAEPVRRVIEFTKFNLKFALDEISSVDCFLCENNRVFIITPAQVFLVGLNEHRDYTGSIQPQNRKLELETAGKNKQFGTLEMLKTKNSSANREKILYADDSYAFDIENAGIDLFSSNFQLRFEFFLKNHEQKRNYKIYTLTDQVGRMYFINFNYYRSSFMLDGFRTIEPNYNIIPFDFAGNHGKIRLVEMKNSENFRSDIITGWILALHPKFACLLQTKPTGFATFLKSPTSVPTLRQIASVNSYESNVFENFWIEDYDAEVEFESAFDSLDDIGRFEDRPGQFEYQKFNHKTQIWNLFFDNKALHEAYEMGDIPYKLYHYSQPKYPGKYVQNFFKPPPKYQHNPPEGQRRKKFKNN